MLRIIVWIRNEPRLIDNHLFEWVRQIQEKYEVLIVYSFNLEYYQYGQNNYRGTELSRIRKKFIIENVIDFKQNLDNVGLKMVLLKDKMENCIDILVEKDQPTHIIYSEHFYDYFNQPEEEMREKLSRSNKYDPDLIKFHQIWGNTVYEVHDLVLDYQKVAKTTYSQFRKKSNGTIIRQCYARIQKGELNGIRNDQIWDIHYRKPQAVIDNIDQVYEYYEVERDKLYQDPMASMLFFGGESQALNRVDEYINEVNGMSNYLKTRHKLKGRNFSSKFSPYISSGVLSARYIYHVVKEKEKENQDNQQQVADSKLFLDHIMIRDYYRYQIAIYKDKLYAANGLMDKQFEVKEKNESILDKWRTGNTGIPIIDACMRELVKTGYLSNKGRQMIASFLAIDIGYDWRYGEMFTRFHFIDHDPYINYGTWNNLSGLGSQKVNALSLKQIQSNKLSNGYNCNQIYQSYQHDPNGEYIKQWVPELRNFPVEYIHEPWAIPLRSLQQIDFCFNKDYNQPIYIEKYVEFEQKNNNTRINKCDELEYEKKMYQKKKARLKW